MDLSPYIGRGFSPEIDRIIATVDVAGIDLQQVQSAVRLCDETEAILYGPDFSLRAIRYLGGRPMLESIAKEFTGPSCERAAAAMRWTHDQIVHPHFAGPTPGDRAMTEEQLIESGRGYCNEQCRVFIALCGVMEVPARLCFLWHANGRVGHTATEVFLDGRWGFHDVTYQVRIQLPDQSFAEARQLRGAHRALAHDVYRDPLTRWFAKEKGDSILSPSPGTPGEGRSEGRVSVANQIQNTKTLTLPSPGVPGEGKQRPSFDLARAGDLFDSIGICNYLIDGVQEVP